MRQEENIYDLVERAAARKGLPRLELWQKALRAIDLGELKVRFEQELREQRWPVWISGARAAVEGHYDPNNLAHILKLIKVGVTDFGKWLRTAYKLPRGPQRDTTGYKNLDRDLFPEIERLLAGEARSAYDAALILADKKKIAGEATRETKAKRVSALYLREGGGWRV